MEEEELKIPQSLDDITPSWLSAAIGLQVTENLKLIPNVQDGLGFLSTMIRANAQVIQDETIQPINLIIKLHPLDEQKLEFVKSERLDETENNFYKLIVPEVLQIVPELKSFFCKSYCSAIGRKTKGSVLILDDLKPKGYYPISFAKNLPIQRLHDVVEFMAEFHFAGRAMELTKGIKLKNEYDFLHGMISGDEATFVELIKSGFEDAATTLAAHGVDSFVCSTVKKYIRKTEKLVQFVSKASQMNPGLVHGDLWTNNMLFRDGLETEGNTVIIDWQLLAHMNPCFDLTTAILSCLTIDEINMDKVNEWFVLYYETYTSLCENHEIGKKFGKESFHPWCSLEELKNYFYTYGMSYAYIWFVGWFDAFKINISKLVRIIEFLICDVQIGEFIDKNV